MSDSSQKLYEGMFLFDPAQIGSSLEKAANILRDIFARAEADVVAIYKWDDRKLAFPVEGAKRGLYMLTYFHVRGTQIANIERDVNLSEDILRCLIVKAEFVSEQDLSEAKDKEAVMLSQPVITDDDDSSEKPSPRPAATEAKTESAGDDAPKAEAAADDSAKADSDASGAESVAAEAEATA